MKNSPIFWSCHVALIYPEDIASLEIEWNGTGITILYRDNKAGFTLTTYEQSLDALINKLVAVRDANRVKETT